MTGDRTEASALASVQNRNDSSPQGGTASVRRLGALGFIIATALGTAIPSAHAEVLIEGDAAALHLRVRQSRISDVFTALARISRVSYSTATRSDKVLNGTYSGSLESVVRRLLDGHNYWIKKHDDAYEIVVVGMHAAQVVLPQAAAELPKPKTLATRWRTP